MISTRTLYIAAFLSLCTVLATIIFAVRSVLRRQRLHGASTDVDADVEAWRGARAPSRRARRRSTAPSQLAWDKAHTAAHSMEFKAGYRLLVQGLLLGMAAALLVRELSGDATER
jgi:hypothetical protein